MTELDPETRKQVRKSMEDIHKICEWRFGRGATEEQMLESLKDIYTSLGDLLTEIDGPELVVGNITTFDGVSSALPAAPPRKRQRRGATGT